MDQNLNTEILDKITKVCICKAIPRAAIKKTIKAGAKTLREVQAATGAGNKVTNSVSRFQSNTRI